MITGEMYQLLKTWVLSQSTVNHIYWNQKLSDLEAKNNWQKKILKI